MKVSARFAVKENHPIYLRVVNINNVRSLVEPVYNPFGVDHAKGGGAASHGFLL